MRISCLVTSAVLPALCLLACTHPKQLTSNSALANLTIQNLNVPGYTSFAVQMLPLNPGSTFTMKPQTVQNGSNSGPINIEVPPGKYQVSLNYFNQTGSTVYSADFCAIKNNVVTLVAGANNLSISVCQNNASPVGEPPSSDVVLTPANGTGKTGGKGGKGGTDGPSQTTTGVTIVNDQIWNDTRGGQIKAQGGNVFLANNTYYWVGYSMSNSVKCYSSTDLVNWTFQNDAYQMNGWIGRPHVVYNATTNLYVMIIESGNGSSRNIPAYLTSSTPCGNYTWVRAEQNVFGYSMGDHSVFQDTDGKAYLVYTFDKGGQNGSMGVALLTDDYLNIKSSIATFTNGGGSCEAGNIAKVGSTYYLFSSDCKWWNSSATMVRTSTDLIHWTNVQKVNTTPFSDNSFNTQTDAIITVVGSQTTSYIYAGDRYSEYTHTGVGLSAWYPLTFDGNGNPTINGLGKWNIDTVSGNWSLAN